MFRTVERYEENGLGLPYPVVLLNMAQEELDADGNRTSVELPDMEELMAKVAVMRAHHPYKLHGSEVRFIRNVLNMTAKDFAEALVMDAATLSRWENGKQEVGGWADKQVRFATVVCLSGMALGKVPDQKALFNLRIIARPEGKWPELVVACDEVPQRRAPKTSSLTRREYPTRPTTEAVAA